MATKPPADNRQCITRSQDLKSGYRDAEALITSELTIQNELW